MQRTVHAKWSRRLVCSRVVLAVLFTSAVGCSGGGDEGPQTFVGEAAVEASAGVTVSTLAALLDFYGGRDVALGLHDCESGAVDVTCNTSDGQSRLETRVSDCQFTFPGGDATFISDGDYAEVVNNPSACTEGFRDVTMWTLDVRDYTYRVLDADGDELESFKGTYTDTEQLRGEGCGGLNSTRVIDGSLQVHAQYSGQDTSLTAEHFELAFDTVGSPCAWRLTANGKLTIVDAANRRHFAQVFGNVGFTFDLGFTTIDGDVANDCIGNATIQTVEPVYLNQADACPTAGFVKVSLEDGTVATIRFTETGGVELDYDDDGQPDQVVASCHDAALTECAG